MGRRVRRIPNGDVTARVPDGKSADQADAQHARSGAHELLQFAEEANAALFVLVLRTRHTDVGGEYVRAVESGIDTAKPDEAAQQEPGADQQDDGQYDLRHDQTAAEACAAAGGQRASARLQVLRRVYPAHGQRRHQAEHEHGRHGQSDSEEQHLRLEAHGFQAHARERRGGHQRSLQR